MTSIPPLVSKPLGRGLRAVGLVVPGVRHVGNQIEPYTQWWSEQNDRSVAARGPLWVALGDSTCLGIGASSPEMGWVGRVADHLRAGEPSWRIINLATSGARIADVMETQLPVLADLVRDSQAPTLVTCCVGTNDVMWSRTGTKELRTEVNDLTAQLPAGTVVATIAGQSNRVVLANRALKQGVRDHRLVLVDPWREPGPGVRERVAGDRFHPSDVGHELIAAAFLRAIDDGR